MFFDISRYLGNKYFDIVWGATSMGHPKKLYFERLNLGCHCFLITVGYLIHNYFDVVWGTTPPEKPLMDPRKINFVNGLTYGASVFRKQ